MVYGVMSQNDYEIHETKVCINTGRTLNDPNREKSFSDQQYFKSSEEMINLFKESSSFIDNTNEISKKCNVSLKTKGYFLPEYPVPKEHDFDTYITDLSHKRLNELVKDFDKNIAICLGRVTVFELFLDFRSLIFNL